MLLLYVLLNVNLVLLMVMYALVVLSDVDGIHIGSTLGPGLTKLGLRPIVSRDVGAFLIPCPRDRPLASNNIV